MAYETLEFGGETTSIQKGEKVEGKLEAVKEEVGKNKSTIYVIDGKQYWGASALDPLMSQVTVGSKVRIECTDDNYKFPSGRSGKHFIVAVDK